MLDRQSECRKWRICKCKKIHFPGNLGNATSLNQKPNSWVEIYKCPVALFPVGVGEKSASIVVIAYRDEQQTSTPATLTKVATLPAPICGGFASSDPHGCPAVLFAVFAATITPILETARRLGVGAHADRW